MQVDNDKKMISVIIPAYNAKRTIKKCIDSVLNQSENDIEVIVVDNGSTDGTYEYLTGVLDSRLRIYKEKRRGVSYARNLGIDQARGDYISFVDSDDCLVPDALNKMIKRMNSRILVCGSYVETRTRSRIKEIIYNEKEISAMCIDEILGIHMSPWAKLYDASVIRNNRIEFPIGIEYGEDACFYIEYCKHIDSIIVMRDIVYKYNMTSKRSASWRFYGDTYKYYHTIYLKTKEIYSCRGIEPSTNYNEVFLMRCLDYYIKHGKTFYLFDACELFGIDCDLKKEIKKYKRNNWRSIIQFKLKKLIPLL